MFVLKKSVTLLMMPLTVCLLVLGCGVLLLWIRRRLGVAKIILTFGVLSLTVLSFTAVANQIIKPLEVWYPPLLDAGRLKDVKWVVVLGGGHVSNPGFPANAQMENQSLARLVEGIRIMFGKALQTLLRAHALHALSPADTDFAMDVLKRLPAQVVRENWPYGVIL